MASHLPGCTGAIWRRVLGALFGFTFNSAMSVSCADSSCYPLWPTWKAAPNAPPCSFIPFRR